MCSVLYLMVSNGRDYVQIRGSGPCPMFEKVECAPNAVLDMFAVAMVTG